MTTLEQASPPARPRRPAWRRWLAPAFSLVLVAAMVFWFLPQFTSLSDVWASVQDMTAVQIGLLALATLWNLATYQFVMVTTTPGMTLRQATVSTETTTAVANTLVGGAAVAMGLTYAMNSSWGFSRSRTSVSLLTSGLWNNFAKLGLPVVALALLAFTAPPTPGRLLAGLLGVAGLVAAVVGLWLVLRSRASAARVGQTLARWVSALLRLVHRPPVHGWDLALTKFRDRTVLLLRARWHWLTLATVVSHLSLFLVLLLALRFCGVGADQVGWAEALAVFAFARLLTAIPFTPGGLGVIEVAMISGLAAAGGDRPAVAAGVLVFRVLTYVLPIPFGVLTYVFWQRNTSWRREPNTAPRTDLVPESA
ncbi:lysylphosphatidylglycerol synthase transmembrane domain-containing protein [Modestobacter altitudinis]|uniref:lysylphosphatidylglycerol synthase transmembrane domain-containing protein n=1 Tax=Modestobacter altitudinis TaxID=2213158 RepID=UPI00110CA038|nr:YbhN family protein [Modestobacter altitudinis]